MKAIQRMHGLILGRAKSGVVKCAACGQILGYIEKEHFDYIYLQLICRCGESGQFCRRNRQLLWRMRGEQNYPARTANGGGLRVAMPFGTLPFGRAVPAEFLQKIGMNAGEIPIRNLCLRKFRFT